MHSDNNGPIEATESEYTIDSTSMFCVTYYNSQILSCLLKHLARWTGESILQKAFALVRLTRFENIHIFTHPLRFSSCIQKSRFVPFTVLEAISVANAG